MPITIEIIGFPTSEAPAVTCRTLESGKLTIGRVKANSDWVLPDRSNTLSGTHCRISSENGGFVMTDLKSTNGSYLNGVRLGKGETADLKTGDRLQLGPYELSVSILRLPHENETDSDKAKGNWLDLLTDESKSPDLPPAMPHMGDQFDVAPPARGANEVRENEALFSAPGNEDVNRQKGPPLPPHLRKRGVPERGPDAEKPREVGRPLPSGLLKREDALKKRGVKASREVPPAVRPQNAPPVNYPDAEPIDEQPALPVPRQESVSGDHEDAEITEAPPGNEPKAQVAEAGGIRKVPPAPSVDPDVRALVDAFLRGADLAPNTRIDDPVAFLEKQGVLFRLLIEELMRALHARSVFKDEMKLGVTHVRFEKNNPLKFMPSADQAMEMFIGQPRKGWLSADDAIRQAGGDLQHHSLALLAGMEAVIQGVVGRLDPSAIEKLVPNTKRKGLGQLVNAAPARAWEEYRREYEKLTAALEENLNAVIGSDFARAYSDELHRLTGK